MVLSAKFTNTLILSILCFVLISGCKKKTEGPYFATGIKIGEVSSDQAVVWIRLTSDSLPAGTEQPIPEIKYRDPETNDIVNDLSGNYHRFIPIINYPEGVNIQKIEGATTGIQGDVMIYYKPLDDRHWNNTDWQSVDPNKDHTTQVSLTNLKAGTNYEIRVVSRYPDSRAIGESIKGRFRTAPAEDRKAEILFTVITGQAYDDQDVPGWGFKIYDSMLKLNPDFFVHTGDILYYDELAKNASLARWHWSRIYSLPSNIRFHRLTTSYFMKDDHDTWVNDCWPGMESNFMGEFTFKEGQKIFLEQVPMLEKTYRTYRWGRDLQIWLMEGRDFRSPNTMPDGPEKTIWGHDQIQWLKNTVASSDATFKILITPTPLVGPDRENKHDNYSNQDFEYEGSRIREWISNIPDMYVITGDRHWQYISVDDETGIKEFSCGPASNEHAGGWSNDRILPEHRYLIVTGGFLAVKVNRIDDDPYLVAYHYDVDGHILNTDSLSTKKTNMPVN